MALEIERKYLNANLTEARARLAQCGAQSEGIHFETNLIFDTANLDLRAKGQILRLRLQEWPDRCHSRLTFKAPPPTGVRVGTFKAREELEASTDSPRIMREILTRLGYIHVATYEKIREAWILHINCGSKKSTTINIDLDQLPFCAVIEIEGEPCEIDAAALLLGLDKYEISLKSYHDLNQSWRKEQGLAPDLDFIFSDTEKCSLRRELGLASQCPLFM